MRLKNQEVDIVDNNTKHNEFRKFRALLYLSAAAVGVWEREKPI
jgi:hypothetical protein